MLLSVCCQIKISFAFSSLKSYRSPSKPEEVTRGNNYEEPMVTGTTQQAGKQIYFEKLFKDEFQTQIT